MGTFFSNIHIRKNESFSMEKLKSFIIGRMESRGFRQEDTGGDAGDCNVIIYDPADSGWVSVASDDFLFNTEENIKAVTVPLSELFCADVIAAECNDSDYLLLSLMNAPAGVDGWINIGRQYGSKNMRRTNISAWKNSVDDYAAFKKIMQKKYVFAEEAFYESAELLNMQTEQMGLETDYSENLDTAKMVKLSFFAPALEKNLPKLEIPRFSLMPCRMDQSDVVSVVNKGGKSRGIGVLFMGECVEREEITFDEVTIEYGGYGEGHRVFPVELKKAVLDNGKKVYYWEDENFPIPPAVSQEIPLMKRMKLEFDREIAVRFVPRGNERKALDITVAVAPLKNWTEGQAIWYVYKYSGSKRKYVEEQKSFLRSVEGGIDPDEYEV